MLQIDADRRTLTPLSRTRLVDAGLQERYDLQSLAKRHPDAFFGELGEQLLLIDDEVLPADDMVGDRIDLLCLDEQGASVVIELKRGTDKGQLLQALSYAGMIRDWVAERFVERYARARSLSVTDADAQVTEFLAVEPDAINSAQRVILLAEGFDYAVLATARWLNEAHGVDVALYQLQLAQAPTPGSSGTPGSPGTAGASGAGGSDDSGAAFLSCTRVFPPPSLREQAAPRGRRGNGRGALGEQRSSRWSSWEEAIAEINNEHVKAFFAAEVTRNREGRLASRDLYFRNRGKRRWSVCGRPDYGYVMQFGRFPGDLDHWRQRLSQAETVQEVLQGQRIRFYLHTQQDFEHFLALAGEDSVVIEFDVTEAGEADEAIQL